MMKRLPEAAHAARYDTASARRLSIPAGVIAGSANMYPDRAAWSSRPCTSPTTRWLLAKSMSGASPRPISEPEPFAACADRRSHPRPPPAGGDRHSGGYAGRSRSGRAGFPPLCGRSTELDADDGIPAALPGIAANDARVDERPGRGRLDALGHRVIAGIRFPPPLQIAEPIFSTSGSRPRESRVPCLVEAYRPRQPARLHLADRCHNLLRFPCRQLPRRCR